MNTQYNEQLKTLGKQTARLVTALYDHSRTTFTLADVGDITGLRPNLASSLVHKAIGRGLITRLKGGLFTLVPQELGSAREYSGDPYLVGQLLAGDAPSFVSHASAMEIHRMVTQPQLAIYISSAKRVRHRTIRGTEFRFVLIKPTQVFGMTNHWVTKQEFVDVSDLERTVIDGLQHPGYCGGVTEVAKGLWMRHTDMRASTLMDYALRLGVGAVIRRLGYLLDLYAIVPKPELERLDRSLTATYVALDPLLPREGAYLSRWRLQLNIPPEELKQIRGS